MLSFLRDNPNRYPLGYHAGLDGLRGTMTLGVMAAHIREAWCPGSFVYMDTFFLMSAYLITSLLLKGWTRDGEIGFARFYVRRALRLFPAFYVMLAAFCILAMFLEDTRGHLTQALVAGVYVSNWTRAFGVEMPQFLGHTWSLAIEEQYYLLWPLLLAGLLKWSGLRMRTVLIVLGGALGFVLWRSWLTFDGAPIERLYNGTDTRADALLIGCALGIALALPQVRNNAALQRFCRAAALPAVIALLLVGYTLQWQMRWMYGGGSVVTSCISALLVAALVLPHRTWAHRIFELPPLVFLGRICYGLYLWHFPIYNTLRFGFGLSDTWVVCVGVPLTFLVAVLSYRYVERPFLAIKDRMPEPARTA